MAGYHDFLCGAASQGDAMSLEINYIDAPEGAQEKMSVSAETENDISDTTLIPAGVQDTPWATLEPEIWKLDGTMRIMPDDAKAGFWSAERSGEDGYFANPPKITISFPVPYGSTGFTFTFSPATNQYCPEVHAKWYSGQTLLIDKDYFPDGPTWIMEETISSFDRIEFTLLRTNNPGQFAKLQRIEIGRTVLFSAKEILSARLVNEIDPTLCELTVDTLSFEMQDSQNRSFLPQENQRIELMHNGKLRSVQYITASTRKAKANYKIECQSAIGLLSGDFLGGMYADKPVADLIGEVLGDWEFELNPTFSEKLITGYLPVCTQREAIQQIAFAIGAIVTTQESSKIRFVPIPKAIAARFRNDDIMVGGSVKSAPRYARVSVSSHFYSKSEDVETLIDEEEISGTDVLFTFASPHYDYEITGGTITGSDVNWVTITAEGVVTLSAKAYLHSTRAYTKRNPEATAKEQGNIIAINKATLINSANAQEAVDRLYSAVQRRQTVNQDVIVSGQKAGQLASSITPWDTITTGFISFMDSTITQNGHIATITIQGIEVTLESVWPYSGELHSGDSEVLY